MRVLSKRKLFYTFIYIIFMFYVPRYTFTVRGTQPWSIFLRTFVPLYYTTHRVASREIILFGVECFDLSCAGSIDSKKQK